VGKSC